MIWETSARRARKPVTRADRMDLNPAFLCVVAHSARLRPSPECSPRSMLRICSGAMGCPVMPALFALSLTCRLKQRIFAQSSSRSLTYSSAVQPCAEPGSQHAHELRPEVPTAIVSRDAIVARGEGRNHEASLLRVRLPLCGRVSERSASASHSMSSRRLPRDWLWHDTTDEPRPRTVGLRKLHD